MSYNPDIAAARRAAKQFSREQGIPHQTMLDILARRAGRADWDAFLANPCSIPPAEGEHPEKTRTSDPEIAHGDLVPTPASRTRGRRELIMTVIGIVFVLGLTTAISLLLHRTNRLTQASTEATDSLVAMESDRVKSTTLRFAFNDHDINRDMPVTSLRRTARGLAMSVMIIDDRFASLEERRREPHPLKWYSGGRAAALSMVEHPVTRFAGDVDCRAGAFIPRRLETADDYRGETHFTHPINPRSRMWKMSKADAARICSTPGQGDVTNAIRRI